jgi:hypothetical protein
MNSTVFTLWSFVLGKSKHPSAVPEKITKSLIEQEIGLGKLENVPVVSNM